MTELFNQNLRGYAISHVWPGSAFSLLLAICRAHQGQTVFCIELAVETNLLEKHHLFLHHSFLQASRRIEYMEPTLLMQV